MCGDRSYSASKRYNIVMLGLLLCDDLIFASRIMATARASGHAMKVARSPEMLQTLAREETPGGVIIDLAHPGMRLEHLLPFLAANCDPRPYVVAYGSHVDAAGLKAARDAGCDLVLPRSKFVEELELKIGEWLSQSPTKQSPA
jgi:DNA-binding NarL/FixJ family response regulator